MPTSWLPHRVLSASQLEKSPSWREMQNIHIELWRRSKRFDSFIYGCRQSCRESHWEWDILEKQAYKIHTSRLPPCLGLAVMLLQVRERYIWQKRSNQLWCFPERRYVPGCDGKGPAFVRTSGAFHCWWHFNSRSHPNPVIGLVFFHSAISGLRHSGTWRQIFNDQTRSAPRGGRFHLISFGKLLSSFTVLSTHLPNIQDVV